MGCCAGCRGGREWVVHVHGYVHGYGDLDVTVTVTVDELGAQSDSLGGVPSSTH